MSRATLEQVDKIVGYGFGYGFHERTFFTPKFFYAKIFYAKFFYANIFLRQKTFFTPKSFSYAKKLFLRQFSKKLK